MPETYSTDLSGYLPARSGNEELLPLEYRGRRVLTSERLADAFGASERQISDNFANNIARFVAGSHFYKVEGAELRALKDRHDFIGSVGRNARSLLLWTDRGVARHAKILDTNAAWEIYEQLEETYFAVRDGRLSVAGMPLPKKLKEVGDVMSGFSRLIGLLGVKGNQRALSAAQATFKETGVNVLELTGVTHLKAEVQERTLNPTELGHRLAPQRKPTVVNQALSDLGLQILHRYRVKGKDKSKWELTEAGKATGAHYDDTAKKHMSGTPVLQIKWTANVISVVQAYFDKAGA